MQPDFLAGLTTAVIGADGFLGVRLCRSLRNRGATVMPFARSTPAQVGADLSSALKSTKAIFYLATSVTPGDAEAFPEKAQADIEEFERLLIGLEELETQPLLVFTSSSTNYDPGFSPPYSEDAPIKPNTVHGETKLRMEQSLLSYSNAVRPVVLRLASLYGPGHPMRPGHGVIAHWLQSISEDRPIKLIGDNGIRRDYVYVDDAAEAAIRTIFAPKDAFPIVLNIGSGQPISLGALMSEIAVATGCQLKVDKSPARSFDRRDLWLRVDRAKAILNWVPRTELPDGLRRSWEAINE